MGDTAVNALRTFCVRPVLMGFFSSCERRPLRRYLTTAVAAAAVLHFTSYCSFFRYFVIHCFRTSADQRYYYISAAMYRSLMVKFLQLRCAPFHLRLVQHEVAVKLPLTTLYPTAQRLWCQTHTQYFSCFFIAIVWYIYIMSYTYTYILSIITFV